MKIKLKERPESLIRVYAVTDWFPELDNNNFITCVTVSHIIAVYKHREAIVACVSASSTWNEETNLILMALDNCGDEFIDTIQAAVDDGASAVVGDSFLQPEEFEKLVMNTNGVCIKPRVKK